MIKPKVGDVWAYRVDGHTHETTPLLLVLEKEVAWDGRGHVFSVCYSDLLELIERDGLRDRALWETLPYEDCPKEWHEMLGNVKGNIIQCYGPNGWEDIGEDCFLADPKCRYRITDRKREPEEPPKSLFKLFEMDWSENMQNIQDADGVRWCAPTGSKHDSYRIFGFTDDAHWTEPWIISVPGQYPHYNYETQPCDHTGNRKYAIGRLEAAK